jgi:hypothetical protein
MKGIFKTQAAFGIIAAIAMFTVVGMASASDQHWKKAIQGEYAITGTGACLFAFTGFNDGNPKPLRENHLARGWSRNARSQRGSTHSACPFRLLSNRLLRDRAFIDLRPLQLATEIPVDHLPLAVEIEGSPPRPPP